MQVFVAELRKMASSNSYPLKDLGSASASMLYDAVKGKVRRNNKLEQTMVVIIDEVSLYPLAHILPPQSPPHKIFMVNSVLFTLADVVARGIKDQFEIPFGGLVLLCLGDPLQGMAVNLLDKATIGSKWSPHMRNFSFHTTSRRSTWP